MSRSRSKSLRLRLAVFAVLAVAFSGCNAKEEKSSFARYDKLQGGAYSVIAEVRAKPGKEADLRAATLPLITAVRNEPNNLLYFLHENRETPGHFIFYEIFATQADFEAHNVTPHVKEWFAKLPELSDGGVKVVRAELLSNRP